MTKTNNVWWRAGALVGFLALMFGAGFFGAQFRPGAWYAALAKPSWTPPNWLFGPVWTALYVAIAMAGWLVWRRTVRMQAALGCWIAQWVLNAVWSWLFFGLHQPGWALVEILVLLGTIIGFVVTAWPVSRGAALLFVPYGLWVTFATALNAAVWHLNRP